MSLALRVLSAKGLSKKRIITPDSKLKRVCPENQFDMCQSLACNSMPGCMMMRPCSLLFRCGKFVAAFNGAVHALLAQPQKAVATRGAPMKGSEMIMQADGPASANS